SSGRRDLGEHVQPVRPVFAVRWIQGERVRARRRPPRSRAVPRACTGQWWQPAASPSPAPHPTPTPPTFPRSGQVSPERLEVRKTYKLYIGGEFPRSESGRSYAAAGPDGEVLARPARASRKDLRDAV